jgi:hypothetical protein
LDALKGVLVDVRSGVEEGVDVEVEVEEEQVVGRTSEVDVSYSSSSSNFVGFEGEIREGNVVVLH